MVTGWESLSPHVDSIIQSIGLSRCIGSMVSFWGEKVWRKQVHHQVGLLQSIMGKQWSMVYAIDDAFLYLGFVHVIDQQSKHLCLSNVLEYGRELRQEAS